MAASAIPRAERRGERGAEEWSFEVDAEGFRAGISRLVLQRDVTGDALGAPADFLRVGRDRRRK